MNAKVERLPLASEARPALRLEQLRIRIAARLQMGLYGKFTRYGLCRDLSVPFEAPRAKIPLEVRRASASDLDAVLNLNDPANTAQDRIEIAWRRAFAEKGAQRCYVAVDLRDNTPCYVHWLFNAADTPFLQQFPNLPRLAPHEALLEDCYTSVKYRGLGIMAEAMARIAERAADIGCSHVITFVDQQNIASLKGCQRAGFRPHLLHHRTQLAFGLVQKNSFVPLAANDPRRTLKF
jgi:GNAT superfamily N-acetyltransferase